MRDISALILTHHAAVERLCCLDEAPCLSTQALIERGADLNKRDGQGNTVLHYAAGMAASDVNPPGESC